MTLMPFVPSTPYRTELNTLQGGAVTLSDKTNLRDIGRGCSVPLGDLILPQIRIRLQGGQSPKIQVRGTFQCASQNAGARSILRSPRRPYP